MKQIEEGNEGYSITITFFNEDNIVQLPSSVAYTVYCVTTETEVIASTALTPAYSIDLALSGDMVALQDSSNTIEKKRICITVTNASGNTVLQTYEYEVVPSSSCS